MKLWRRFLLRKAIIFHLPSPLSISKQFQLFSIGKRKFNSNQIRLDQMDIFQFIYFHCHCHCHWAFWIHSFLLLPWRLRFSSHSIWKWSKHNNLLDLKYKDSFDSRHEKKIYVVKWKSAHKTSHNAKKYYAPLSHSHKHNTPQAHVAKMDHFFFFSKMKVSIRTQQ